MVIFAKFLLFSDIGRAEQCEIGCNKSIIAFIILHFYAYCLVPFNLFIWAEDFHYPLFFEQAKDISDLGSLKEASKIFVPGRFYLPLIASTVWWI